MTYLEMSYVESWQREPALPTSEKIDAIVFVSSSDKNTKFYID